MSSSITAAEFRNLISSGQRVELIDVRTPWNQVKTEVTPTAATSSTSSCKDAATGCCN